MRSSKSRSRSKSNRNRSMGNVVNRVFDSSGPEGKVRGTPQQVIEKYNQLARDAQLSGDRVAAENFAQHAEHYTRLLAEAMKEQEARREQQEAERRERDAARQKQNEKEQGTSDDAVATDDGADGAEGNSELVETPENAEKPAAKKPRRPRKPKPVETNDEQPAPEAAE